MASHVRARGLNSRVLAGLGVALGLGLVLYALFAAKSDEEVIRERLAQLARAVSTVENENIVFRKSRLDREFEQVLADDVRADIPELGSSPRGRSALANLAVAATRAEPSLQVEIDPKQVTVHETRAEVEATADVLSNGSEPERATRRVAFQFEKDSKHGWRITTVRVDLE